MRKIYVLILAVLCSACSIEYLGDTRLVFQTRVLDSQGNPIGNVPVNIIVSEPGDSDIISTGNTDSSGRVELIFPAPKRDTARIHVEISHYPKVGKNIRNIKKSDFERFKFELGDINLFDPEQVTTLDVSFNPTTPNAYVTQFWIENIASEFVFWNEQPTDQWFMNTVAKNSVATIHYVVNYGNSQQTFEEEVSIGENPVNHVISY